MITTYIGVGTNIDREQHAKVAYLELQKLGEDLLVSPIYECEPIGFSSQNFYNFVIVMRTKLSLEELSHHLREIEYKWGVRKMRKVSGSNTGSRYSALR